MRILAAITLAYAIFLISETHAFAQNQPQDYVRVCDTFGGDYFYLPGNNFTCVDADTQETRTETEFGTEIGKTAFAMSVDQRIEQAFQAIAISNALADPDLVAGERFGVKINWGGVEGVNAFGFSGAVVVADGLFDGGRGRLAGSGGVAFSGGTVGGRAGLQLTW